MGHAGLDQLVDHHVADVVAGLGHHVAVGIRGVLGEAARVQRVLDVRVPRQHAQRVRRGDRQVQSTGRAAVVFADDDILRDVHETTGEVPGVGGTESGVCEALASTASRSAAAAGNGT